MQRTSLMSGLLGVRLAVVILLLLAAVVFSEPGVILSANTDKVNERLTSFAGVAPHAASDAPTKARVNEVYGKLPLYFEANRGQTDQRVKFLSRGPGHTMFLTPTDAVLVLTKAKQTANGKQQKLEQTGGSVLRMTFLGANSQPRMAGREELPGKVNYFIGNDPEKWRTNVPIYDRVQYQNIYPGIDLTYYGNQRQLEYDIVVQPGADPNSIMLGFKGADNLDVDAQGDLVLHTALGAIRQQRPFIYQEADGVRSEISGSYLLKGRHQVGFQVGAYDASKQLIIDPVLFYSTYLGGSNFEEGIGIAVDLAGNAYVTGDTNSIDFPTTTGAFQTTNASGGCCDAFVTKLNPTGSGLVYSTYLGGSISTDVGFSIAVDTLGNAFVTGQTISTDFPTTPGAFQTTGSGGGDAFVTKLNPTGSGLVYSTYLGEGSVGYGVAVDSSGNAYVTGGGGLNFPTTPGAFQTTVGGGEDAFVTKLNPMGSGLVYSTYLGGGNGDLGQGIALDSSRNAYVTGYTNSTNFPTTPGAFQTIAPGGTQDAFVTKLNPLGIALTYSTYLGGSSEDFGFGIAVDTLGNAYVTGETASTNFPTTIGAFQTTLGGSQDAFVTKLNPLGVALTYSTYLGGSNHEEGHGVAIDTLGNAYVAGGTTSANFPTVNAVQAVSGGGFDAFATAVNPLGNALVYSSYLGGSGTDNGFGIALDALPNPNAYITGFTTSTDFPTTSGAFQTTSPGGGDAFVTKIADITMPQGPTVGKVTGGGTINVSGGIGNFGFIVQAESSTGPISGDLQYLNHASGEKIHSVTFATFTISGNTATFSGTCTNNGVPCTFSVMVQDNGEPGKNDVFTISINAGPPQGGTLRSGNIQIH